MADDVRFDRGARDGSDGELDDGSRQAPDDGDPTGASFDGPDVTNDYRSSVTAEDPAGALNEMRDKYLRLAAEYENYRKRVLRDRQEGGVRAQGDLVRQLLEALDDLGRVAHVDPSTTDAATVINGVELVERKLLKSLSAAGLEVIQPVAQPFNPELHEAITTAPALSPEDDHMVAQVYQQGYVFKGQLLRPARVVVKQWNG